MKAVTKILAGGVAIAALASAAPAAAQYYPGYGYQNGGNVVGQVLNQVLGGNQYGYGNQICLWQWRQQPGGCAALRRGGRAADQPRLQPHTATAPITAMAVTTATAGITAATPSRRARRASSASPASSAGRTTACESAESPRPMLMRAATAPLMAAAMAGTAAMPHGYAAAAGGELTFKCNVDYRGYISDIDLDRNNYAYSPTAIAAI